MDNKNLIELLKLFDGRPNHLAKYLIDNSAFKESFLKKVVKSTKILNIDINDIEFNDINDIDEYLNSLLQSDDRNISEAKINGLNDKLFKLIKEENYEEAKKVHNYMLKNNIKIILK